MTKTTSVYYPNEGKNRKAKIVINPKKLVEFIRDVLVCFLIVKVLTVI